MRSRFRLKHSFCPSCWEKWAPPGCFIGTKPLNRLIMQSYYCWELRKFQCWQWFVVSLSDSCSLATELCRFLALFSFQFFMSFLLAFNLFLFLPVILFLSDLFQFPGLRHSVSFFFVHIPILCNCSFFDCLPFLHSCLFSWLCLSLWPLFIHFLLFFLPFSLSLSCFPIVVFVSLTHVMFILF